VTPVGGVPVPVPPPLRRAGVLTTLPRDAAHGCTAQAAGPRAEIFMPKVLVQNEALEVELNDGENLRTGLKRNHITVYDGMITKIANCRGHGFCGTCKVIVIEGRDNLSAPTEKEIKKLKDEGVEAGLRLSCQASVTKDCEVHCHP
jgi:ferredoxin